MPTNLNKIIKIYIPTYNRVGNVKTIKCFSDPRFFECILVVRTPEEAEEYQKCYPTHQILITHKADKGIIPQREFIREIQPKGEWYFSADDDLDGFYSVVPRLYNTPQISEADLKAENFRYEMNSQEVYNFFLEMIEKCEKEKSHLFGVGNSDNHFFRKRKFTYKCFIIGQFFGEKKVDIIDYKKLYSFTDTSPKDDYMISLIHIVYKGNNIRNNYIRPITKMYQIGGVGISPDRIKKMEQASRNLKKTFPYITHDSPRGEKEILIRASNEDKLNQQRKYLLDQGIISKEEYLNILKNL